MMSVAEAFRIELADSHPEVCVVVVYPGKIITDFGKNAAGQPMGDSCGKLPADVLAVIGGAQQTAEEVA